MKRVTQVLPNEQVDILKEALSIMEVALASINKNNETEQLNHKIFDIFTLKGMLNNTEVSISLPFDVYENFTSLNGVDYPNYIE